MPTYQYNDGANEATGFSGFGGHLLSAAVDTAAVGEAPPSGDGYLDTLEGVGIEDAEQLTAAASIPEVREELQAVLGIDDSDFQALLDWAGNVLPPDRAALLSAPAPRDLGLGVLAPPPDLIAVAQISGDYADPAKAVALPRAVNLLSFMPPVKSQGGRGVCVGFTLTALHEYVLRRLGVVRDLSEQHLYFETKQIDGSSNACGTFQARAVSVLETRGQCREEIWPYNPSLPCNNHGALPAQARPDGLNYRLATLAVPARDVVAYKTHLASQRPVTLSIPVYDSWYRSAETRRSGRITMRIGNEPAVGGHAVCLIGYNDDQGELSRSPGGGYFIVRNSWGTTWGSQSPYGGGYGVIPYQYIANEAWEAFTAYVPQGGTC